MQPNQSKYRIVIEGDGPNNSPLMGNGSPYPFDANLVAEATIDHLKKCGHKVTKCDFEWPGPIVLPESELKNQVDDILARVNRGALAKAMDLPGVEHVRQNKDGLTFVGKPQ